MALSGYDKLRRNKNNYLPKYPAQCMQIYRQRQASSIRVVYFVALSTFQSFKKVSSLLTDNSLINKEKLVLYVRRLHII